MTPLLELKNITKTYRSGAEHVEPAGGPDQHGRSPGGSQRFDVTCQKAHTVR